MFPGNIFKLEIFTPAPRCALVAENGVADVIVVRCLRAVKEERVFQLGRIADDAAVADDDILAEIGVVADLAILSDDGPGL